MRLRGGVCGCVWVRVCVCGCGCGCVLCVRILEISQCWNAILIECVP